MSIPLYDEAILRKLKFWVKDNKLTILGVDQSTDLFKYRSDIADDKPLQLPIISLSRHPEITINSTTKQPLSFDGLKIEGNESKTNQLNAIPITIQYQLDVYTRYSDEAQEYMRNFIFNFINYPALAIEIPYNSAKIIINGYIHIAGNYTDNSDIPELLIRDQFNRETLNFTVEAYLYDYRPYDNWKINADDITVLLCEAEVAEAENSIDVIIKGE